MMEHVPVRITAFREVLLLSRNSTYTGVFRGEK
jgi:hypothetical protein